MICSKCNTDNRPEARFCKRCGSRLTAAKPESSPPKPDPRRLEALLDSMTAEELTLLSDLLKTRLSS